VSSSASASVFGQAVIFTASISVPVAGTPTGTVQFQIDGGNVGSPVTVSTSGGGTIAIFSIATLAVGNHTIIASYSGDGTFASSSGALTGGQTINKAATSVIVRSTASASVSGQTVTFTATISVPLPGAGTPTGTVQFQIDDSNVGSPVAVSTSAGVTTASFSIAAQAVGTHTLTASYSGSSNFAGGSASMTQTVNKASTSIVITSSASPSVFGQTVTFTATISVLAPGSGTPSGTVGFQIDGSNSGNPVSVNTSGGITTASFSTTTLTVGTHTVTVSYSGDGNFASSTGTLSDGQIVKNGAGGNVAVTLNPSSGLLTIKFRRASSKSPARAPP
jgi:hypothetical protein